MALRYTGLADEFNLPGHEKPYKYGDIVPISEKDALHMIQSSGNLHSFEIVKSGKDLEDEKTTPDPVVPTTIVLPDDAKKGGK